MPVVRSREVAYYGPMGPSSNVMSPEKQRLRQEVSYLRETLGRQGDYAMGVIGEVENKAEKHISDQRQQFETAARQFEREARDVSEAEVAKERASVQDLKNSLIQAEQQGADKSLHIQNVQDEAERILKSESQAMGQRWDEAAIAYAQ
eukprot:1543275-Karenia_brevis.AAC.1